MILSKTRRNNNIYTMKKELSLNLILKCNFIQIVILIASQILINNNHQIELPMLEIKMQMMEIINNLKLKSIHQMITFYKSMERNMI